jgi:hypothetical protein
MSSIASSVTGTRNDHSQVRLGSAHLADFEFVEAFENCTLRPENFHHADHVRLAWLYLNQFDGVEAEQRFREGLVKLAAHFGVPEKFHLTMTLAWLRAVQERIVPEEETSFEDWIAGHPELLDKNLLLDYYSKERLSSLEARANWLEPDRKALSQAVW